MIDVAQTRDTFDRAIADDHEAAHLFQQLVVLRREESAASGGWRSWATPRPPRRPGTQ